MTNQTTIETLAELLGQVDATPVIQSTRFAPSTIYDIDYRLAIVACAFDVHGKRSQQHGRRVRAIWLKLVQFIAARPWLLPAFRDWATAGKASQPNLLVSHSLRRGFLDDRTHDRVVFYLTAYDAFRRERGFLIESARTAALLDLAAAIGESNLFEEERRVVRELARITPTVKMLEAI